MNNHHDSNIKEENNLKEPSDYTTMASYSVMLSKETFAQMNVERNRLIVNFLNNQLQKRINKHEQDNPHTIIVGASGKKYKLMTNITDRKELYDLSKQHNIFRSLGDTTLGKGAFGKAVIAFCIDDNEFVVAKKVKNFPQGALADIENEAK